MNAHSLYFQDMARIIDESKIEKIRQAAIQLVVSEGFGGASVSKIAKTAGVAEGYLYRYHASKTDLINSILHESLTTIMDQIEALLLEDQPLAKIVEKTVSLLFDLAANDAPRMKFIYVLLSDYNFSLDEIIRSRTIDICTRIHARGQAAGHLSAGTQPEDIYLMSVSFPIQFINHRLKGYFGNTDLDDAACEKVSRISLKALTINI